MLAPAPYSSAKSSSRVRRCWAVADLGDERLGPIAIEVQVQPFRLLDQPFREIPGLDIHFGRDLAAGLLDSFDELRRCLVAALFAGEERDRERLGVGGVEGLRDRLDVGILPAFDAVGDHEPPSHRERHRAQRGGDVLGRALVGFVDLDAGRPGGRLRHRAKLRPALGDAAVVVAVDQVGGAEAGHGARG